MSAKVIVKDSLELLSAEAAVLSTQILAKAIDKRQRAQWLLAGGSAPLGAYKLLSERYRSGLDWSKIFVAIGDERRVPSDHPDSNWGVIERTFLNNIDIPINQQLRPETERSCEYSALLYQRVLQKSLSLVDGIPLFDLVWLGMGEDGHTLSLFPGNEALKNQESLVVPVYNSPKPPPERISLTFHALAKTDHCLIMTSGEAKSKVLAQIFAGDKTLPITQAIYAIENSGGQVTWLLDGAAASRIK